MITNLIQCCSSALFWGFIITASVMIIMYFVLKNLSKGCVKSIPFIVAYPVFFFILLYNSTLLIGACKAKSYVGSIELYVKQLVAGKNYTVDILQSQEILNEINEEFPIISSYINLADFSGNETQNLAEAISDTMRRFFNVYIWKKIGWLIGFTVLMFIIAVVSDKGGNQSGGRSQRRRPESNGSNSERLRSRTSSRRISRVPRRITR